jgi:hypothetical protein
MNSASCFRSRYRTEGGCDNSCPTCGINWLYRAVRPCILLVSSLAAQSNPHIVEIFQSFVGQSRAKANLEAAITRARSNGEMLGHVLLVGSPGLGKATLALRIATAMGVNFRYTDSKALSEPSDLVHQLFHSGANVAGMEKGDVFLIDDIDQLNPKLHAELRQAMQENYVNVHLDFPESRSLRLQLPLFTVVATAQQKESIPRELLSCFSLTEELIKYTPEERAQIEEIKVARFGQCSFEMSRAYPGCTNYFSEELGRYVTFEDVEEMIAEGSDDSELMQERIAELEIQLAQARRPVIRQESGGGLILGGLLGYAIAKEKYCPHCGRDIG